MKSIRIKDIALKANVSTGTVDRVLHDRGRVSDQIRERVLKVAREMNYEPNLMARALVSNKVYHLAVLMPDNQTDPYWDAPKAGIEKAQSELKRYKVAVHPFVFDPYSSASFVEKAQELTDSQPDGIFIPPIFYKETQPFIEQWTDKGIPYVFFNTDIADSGRLSYIGQDSYQSGFLAGKLIEYGQPDPCSVLIAHIDEETSNSAHLMNKERGFRDFFTQHLLNEKYHLLRTELRRADFAAFTTQLDDICQNTPDLKSIYVTTSKAYEIAAYLEQRRIRHIRIVGYDLITRNINYLNKGTISFLINQNPHGQGYWGIHYLARHLVFKEQVKSVKHLPLDVVTKENLQYYIDEDDTIDISLTVSGGMSSR
ncbi:substrate-binding domain-containing protein [Mucilaginibacter daejeonensis]|uniref:LacI family DNA-binding transcriptional regulator n=1 Tax=Mucilaginibacter daejeonensis TaxID=398049 RepID=UPI001D172414|nr:substrate-binding domain-containing protein [Mucilaginibacter daejeonensis]UEG54974.1 substrate-binding domain-containing protein [Mucilaginibacter daejeonensis]